MNENELLAHLRAVDPALTSNAPPPEIDRLMEDAMTADTTTRQTQNPARITAPTTSGASGRGRRRLLVPAAVAAVLLMGGGITWGVIANQGKSPSTGPLALTVQGGAADARCAEPTVDTLRGYAIAFEGTVTSKQGNHVDFRVDHWFRGKDPAAVRLTNDENSPEGMSFHAGQSYLVTAENGVVPACGGSSLATDETRSLFRQAFEK